MATVSAVLQMLFLIINTFCCLGKRYIKHVKHDKITETNLLVTIVFADMLKYAEFSY